MIALILPDAVPWESVIRAELGPHRVFRAPGAFRPLQRLPARWALPARLNGRRLAGRLAALWLPEDTTEVVAPSLAAGHVFARAATLGARTLLLEDLPDLDGLARDLDAAALAHPADPFLRNVRPARALVHRQQGERMVADAIRVQSRYAADRRPGPPLFPTPRRPPAGRLPRGAVRARLAGPALSRAGVMEALALVEALPWLTVEARLLPQTPTPFRAHPRVGPISSRRPDLVIAPSWVEAQPPEVREAARDGVPIVGTRRALGWETGREVPVGDVGALVRAVRRLRQDPGPPASV